MLKGLLGKRRGKAIAVADIGGEGAGVAIIEAPAKGPVRVLAAERATLPPEERSSEANASGVIARLEEAAQKALAAYARRTEKPSPHVSAAYAIVRAPWTRSVAARAEAELPEGALVDDAAISAAARQALAADTKLDHAKILDASVVRIELNGYQTAKPEGKPARHIAVVALLSECDPAIRAGISETLVKTFACPPPTLRSGARALLAVLRENGLLREHCLIVETTSRATSLIAVRRGAVAEIAYVPEGTSSIVKRIAGDKMPEETLALIRMLSRGECETESCQAIKEAIARAEPELVKIFGDAMAGISAARRLPDSLILLAPADLSEWLVQFFSRIDFAPFTITTRPFSPGILSAQKDLAHSLSLESGVNPDPALSVACALIPAEEQST
ncbi:hypothetical protein A3C21_00130 [Candidatus Kaiserbacteria bacterium RIFCSPHIGHO2_02_FULL_59_21]|uniref:SHS2 domain-containing protein n=1 Tax=Candidatus Kaiserbacteria bacterium RIFCSPHIGHO2_02_FULL_59_21 TaxID=1798500 RepID=A0A1F6E1B4_9BACT|nr:MAG: hypothetical protein A2766_00965 [Candidatus Kaiserbacteria bacterium RIFCSPHIGHO2_01_FULL_58_22]OGG67495.1 MAG: hypothetical protein A3C21_00130 [Candidatus Kaiserbacteria bacterium RIFCSPHIGHO2_02_FULL_59_21]OGG80095.1 MAG: hypothetical protein A2952_03335 [Candidatus Kaiserbacteria bacterium RIFCSPLOWO2_01_FULL_59_34]OGG86448.1 MAG: hypothetical protein A3I47_03780 [Candidatus Kaiserbacteria bacterium RIFCSPLOWO2_02_FULL_59_19]